jgi:GxxExxY protein
MDADSRRLDCLTRKIIGAAYNVANILGCGFVERVYAKALSTELTIQKIDVAAEYPIKVYYKGAIAGEFYADLLVVNEILVEIKAVKNITNLHLAQCLNYLKGSGLKICLLINFAQKVEVRRIVNNF